MKTLNLIIAILLCTQDYGQVEDFETLSEINSEERFLKVVLENGYHKDEESTETSLVYSIYRWGWMRAGFNKSNDYWWFGYNNTVYGSDSAYRDIAETIKTNCKYRRIIEFNDESIACYQCPNSNFTGLVGLSNEEDASYIMHFGPLYLVTFLHN